MADRFMKVTATSLAAAEVATERSLSAIISDLVKARLTGMVLLTTAMGFYLGSAGSVHLVLMVHTLAATAMLACGAAILNQWMERDLDAKMERTERRPIPSGEMSPDRALMFGGLLSTAGLIYLVLWVDPLTAFLGVVTLVTYLLIYTPLKRVTPMNTVVGAVPGALPPLMGWAAANGGLSAQGWTLFAILFFWQLPHFLAIAWLYRDDYERAGFQMLPMVDPEGIRTGRMAVSQTVGLFLMSLFPYLFRMAGGMYLLGAILLGTVFLVASLRFYRKTTRATARQLFFTSIVYLPLLSALLVLDKVRS